MLSNPSMVSGGVAIVAQYLETYKEFPPSRRPALFTIDLAMKKLKQGINR